MAVSALAAAGPAAPLKTVGPGVRLTTTENGLEAPDDPLLAAYFLSPADVERYRRVFALQEAGDMDAADGLIAEIEDRRLMGHVLYQRFMHPTAWRSRYGELRDWMANYADHPNARRIYELAMTRRPANARRPQRAISINRQYGTVENFGVESCRYDLGRRRNRAIERQVARYLRRRHVTVALNYLEERRGRLHRVEFDRLRADIAAGYFHESILDKALEHATASAERSGGRAPEAYWVAGLASWRMQDYESAAGHFENFANAECGSSWGRSAGAFWAARAHLRNRNPAAVSEWLGHAAEHTRTFYGQLALRSLGVDNSLNFAAPPLTEAHFEAVASVPAAHRAVGLLQIGNFDLANLELIRIRPADAPPLVQQALVAIADQAGLPRLALAVGGNVRPSDGGYYDGALYPLTNWEPTEGYQVDRALIHAVMRQESRFNPTARSRAGARGLMQLMPRTAIFIGGRSFRGQSGRRRLYDPAQNLQLGQDYMARLLGRERGVDNDVMRMLIAYNAGPGNLRTWLRNTQYDNDALLFIESIPNRESRGYIERVLANLWIYRQRLGQPTPSMDRIAAGAWPRYTSLDNGDLEVASRGEN